jgi:hypothetical protein
MNWQPAKQRLNGALILLLISLLAYSSMGFFVTVTPVQADTSSLDVEDAPPEHNVGADLANSRAPAHLTP